MLNFIAYAIALSALLLGALASSAVNAADAPGDTYNFYFQKAPGPVTVNQGGAQVPLTPPALPPGATLPPAAPAIAAPPASVAQASFEEPVTFKKVYLSLGYATTGYMGSGPSLQEIAGGNKSEILTGQYALKGEVDLFERLSVTGELYKLNKEVGFDRGYYKGQDGLVISQPYYGKDKLPSARTVLDFSLGGAVHLVRLKTTTFSLIGGLSTLPSLKFEEVSKNRYRALAVSHERALYGGARLRLLADNVWGVDLSYKAMPSLNNWSAQAGLTFAL